LAINERREGEMGDLTFRSYEFNSLQKLEWARLLDTLFSEWRYKFGSFNIPENDAYAPDFYLPSIHCFIEVVPQFNSEARERALRIAVLAWGQVLLVNEIGFDAECYHVSPRGDLIEPPDTMSAEKISRRGTERVFTMEDIHSSESQLWEHLHFALYGEDFYKPYNPWSKKGPIEQELETLRSKLNDFAVQPEVARRTRIGSRKRFKVFRRDGYKCQLCGRNPSEDRVKLHVDHKTPVSKGGSNAMSNLWTLCQDCNFGKSDLPLEK
jgi:hypothetical protein